MKTNFTKGEWETNNQEVWCENIFICSIYEIDMFNKDIESIANAKLISAAPELFESLCEFIDAWEEGMPMDSSMINTAKQAIKKATE